MSWGQYLMLLKASFSHSHSNICIDTKLLADPVSIFISKSFLLITNRNLSGCDPSSSMLFSWYSFNMLSFLVRLLTAYGLLYLSFDLGLQYLCVWPFLPQFLQVNQRNGQTDPDLWIYMSFGCDLAPQFLQIDLLSVQLSDMYSNLNERH